LRSSCGKVRGLLRHLGYFQSALNSRFFASNFFLSKLASFQNLASLAHSAFSKKIDFWLRKLINLTQSAFFCQKAVECGKCIFVVGFTAFVLFSFVFHVPFCRL
jgi:hypothetical protein